MESTNLKIKDQTQKESEKKPKIIKQFVIKENILKNIFNLESEIINNKHKLCKHPNGCISHCVDISSSGFLIGYTAQATVSFLLVLLKQRKDLISKPFQTIGSVLINKNNIKFGMFPCIQQILRQGIQCLLRNHRNKSDGLNAFISGFISGLSLLLVKKGLRQVWAMYLLVRALECCLNSLIIKKKIPDTQWNWLVIFSLMWSLQAYNMCFETGNNPDSFNKFAVKNMYEDIADTTVRRAWIGKKNQELFFKSAIKPFNVDNKIYIGKPSKQIDVFGFKN